MFPPRDAIFPPPVSETAALSVLVIDSNRDCADSLADLLRLLGYGVQAAYDRDSAIAAEPPDVVILELRLPGTNGWKLVEQMRARVAHKPSFYIAVTTCGQSQDFHRSERAGIDRHLVKPVHPSVLINQLRQRARASE